MTKLQNFTANFIALSFSAILMRIASLYFNVYLKSRLGSDGIGLFTLIMSIYAFAETLACSGISLGVTRLCSEAFERKREDESAHVMRSAFLYSLFFGSLSTLLLFSLSPLLSMAVGDQRVTRPLMLLSVMLIPISLISALSGYFTARRSASKNAAGAVIEQILRISFTIAIFTYLAPSGKEEMCLSVILGSVSATLVSFAFSFTLYLIDKRKRKNAKRHHRCERMASKLRAVSLPVAISAYFRSGLVTLEHILIPKGLKKYTKSSAAALSLYGSIHGMAMPVLLFPYALLSPFCSMTVPEIASNKALDDIDGLSRLSKKAMRITLCFGFALSGYMILNSSLLGRLLYSSESVSLYIRYLAPLLPIMYLDTCIDSILKGAGEQLYSMRVNIIDAILSVVLVYFLTPLFGGIGYILSIIICEIINMSLSLTRLFKISSISGKFFFFILILLLCTLISSLASNFITSLLPIEKDLTALIISSGIYFAVFFLLLALIGRAQRRLCPQKA